MAITADGKIATANRRVSTFGSARDLEHLYGLRATADAILCGARTVELNRTTLGAGGEKFQRLRARRGLAKNALRLVVSGSGSISPKAHIFTTHFAPLIVLTTKRAAKAKLCRLAKLADLVCVGGRTRVDWPSVLRWLRGHFNVRRLLVEGGGELNGELFRLGLVDELHLTVCPKIAGGRNAPTIADGEGALTLAEAGRFELKRMKRAGDEMFLVYRRKPDA
ncbi:MAG: dihydrofolate reductase family protein [Verrucomicrobia bacterium]|nr:dihydrofolate reductase family protein [Verrucomicrobiota bacterium]